MPTEVQRQAGIKAGDRLEFKVSGGVITITAVQVPAYKPTKAEWTAIRKGEAAIARGDSVLRRRLLYRVLQYSSGSY